MIREYSLVFTWVLAWFFCMCCCLGPMRHIHMHGMGEREKATSVLLASCVNAMAKLVGLVGNSGWKERCKEKVTGKRGERGDAHELLTSPDE